MQDCKLSLWWQFHSIKAKSGQSSSVSAALCWGVWSPESPDSTGGWQGGGGGGGDRGCRVILGRQSSKKEVTAHNLGFVLLTFIVFPFNPCGGVGRDANRPTQEESNWLRSESKSIAPRGGIPPELNPIFSCNLTPEQREWSLCRKAVDPKKLDCRHARNSVLMSFRSD